MPQSRQLAAIMFTDIVGYTALMGNDEQKAFSILNKNRELQKPIIEKFNGRWIKELGDGVMASFNTVSDAVNAAIKIQEACNAAKDFQLRIGIHLGEVVFENDDVFGDRVNIASRIQSTAKPGSIYISESVHRNVSNKKDIRTKFVKEEVLKNVKEAVRIYEIITTQADDFFLSAMKEQLTKATDKSIAVLPFVNMSNDPEQEYFSDGIAEEIINSLTHLKDLKVASRTSAFQFKGKNIDLREMCDKLGVNTVLEGSVRKQGNRLRITALLIDVSDGFHLWSERYDREMDDVFAIQDEIALAITEKLKVTLFENDRKLITKLHTHNTEAYQLYLQGRYFWNKRNGEGLKTALRYFEKAIEKDPDYASAWAGLADTYNMLGEFTDLSRWDLYPKAKSAANKALELDNSLAEAHISLASLYMMNEWDWINAGREYRTGIELNPNYATGHHWYAEWLLFTGMTDEGLKEISLAVELDPVSQAILKDKGMFYYYTRQYDQAIDIGLKVLELDPDFITAYRLLSLAYQGKGMFEKSIEENQRWGDRTGNKVKTEIALAQIYGASGRKEGARKIIKKVEADFILTGNDYRGVALVYTALGETDKAFKWLEKSYEKHEDSLCTLKVDPKLDPLRSDKRFNTLLKKIRLAN